jgi:hypothetical protein
MPKELSNGGGKYNRKGGGARTERQAAMSGRYGECNRNWLVATYVGSQLDTTSDLGIVNAGLPNHNYSVEVKCQEGVQSYFWLVLSFSQSR